MSLLVQAVTSLTSVAFVYTFVSRVFAPGPLTLWMGAVEVLRFCIGSFRTHLEQSVLVRVHRYTCIARLDVLGIMSIRHFHFRTSNALRFNQLCSWLP